MNNSYIVNFNALGITDLIAKDFGQFLVNTKESHSRTMSHNELSKFLNSNDVSIVGGIIVDEIDGCEYGTVIAC